MEKTREHTFRPKQIHPPLPRIPRELTSATHFGNVSALKARTECATSILDFGRKDCHLRAHAKILVEPIFLADR